MKQLLYDRSEDYFTLKFRWVLILISQVWHSLQYYSIVWPLAGHWALDQVTATLSGGDAMWRDRRLHWNHWIRQELVIYLYSLSVCLSVCNFYIR